MTYDYNYYLDINKGMWSFPLYKNPIEHQNLSVNRRGYLGTNNSTTITGLQSQQEINTANILELQSQIAAIQKQLPFWSGSFSAPGIQTWNGGTALPINTTNFNQASGIILNNNGNFTLLPGTYNFQYQVAISGQVGVNSGLQIVNNGGTVYALQYLPPSTGWAIINATVTIPPGIPQVVYIQYIPTSGNISTISTGPQANISITKIA